MWLELIGVGLGGAPRRGMERDDDRDEEPDRNWLERPRWHPGHENFFAVRNQARMWRLRAEIGLRKKVSCPK
jgi:hypothetical protein